MKFDAIALVEIIAGRPQDGFEEFSPAQHAVILEGVQLTGMRLAEYMEHLSRFDVSSEDAFRLVFGRIQFGYDVDRDSFAHTNTFGDPTEHRNLIQIVLDDDSFDPSVSGNQPFGVLPGYFVVVHELGHVFHNRICSKLRNTCLSCRDACGSKPQPNSEFVSP